MKTIATIVFAVLLMIGGLVAASRSYPPVIDQMWDQNKQPVRLEMTYIKTCKPVVEEQMMKAGVRLAKLLNDTLGDADNP